jgi:hypothetical protein
MAKTVKIPAELLEKIWDISRAVEDLQDEVEDCFLAQDPVFLEQMRAERDSQNKGDVQPLDMLKKRLCIE